MHKGKVTKGDVTMANKTNRRLALRKETLRQLSESQLRNVAGGYASGYICAAAEQSGKCGSTTSLSDVDTRDLPPPDGR